MSDFENKLKNLLSFLDLETTVPRLWLNDYFDRVVSEIDVIAESKINAINVLNPSSILIDKINKTRDRFITEINKLKEANFSYYEEYKVELNTELDEIIESSKAFFIQNPKRKAIMAKQFNMKMLYYLRRLFFSTCFLVSTTQNKNELIGNLIVVDYYLDGFQIEQIRSHVNSVLANSPEYNDIYYSDWVLINSIIQEIDKKRDSIVDMQKSDQFVRLAENEFKHAYESRVIKIEQALANNSSKLVPYSIYNLKNMKTFTTKDCFRKLVNLNYLAKYSFENLDTLSLINTQKHTMFSISEFKTGFFAVQKGFANLKTLDLSENNMSDWKFGSLECLPNLNYLNLQDNNIHNFKSLWFKLNSPTLKKIQFSYNEYNEWDSVTARTSPSGLKSLEHFELRRAPIFLLSKRFFSGFSNLKCINFEESAIKKIESGSFDDLVQLEKLVLRENCLTRLDKNLFVHLKKLKTLDISRNMLKKFNPDQMIHSDCLENLSIGDNNFTIRSGTSIFTKLATLKVLEIEGLNIKKLDKSMFVGLVGLKSLCLDFNSIKCIEGDSFVHLESLEFLSLMHCDSLKRIESNAFNGLRNLNELILKYCYIESVSPLAFSGLIELEMMELNGNFLKAIDFSAFSKLGKLRYLDVSSNNLIMNESNMVQIEKIKSMNINMFDYQNQYGDQNEP